MKQFLILLLAVTTGGCFAGVTNSTRTCIPNQQGLIGCVNSAPPLDLSDKSLPRHEKMAAALTKKPRQAGPDKPEHTAEALLALAPWCPMQLDAPGQTPDDHFNMALAARMFSLSVALPDPDGGDIVRQMFLNCWALSVHYGLSDHRTFYQPIHALSSFSPEPAATPALQLFLGPSGDE